MNNTTNPRLSSGYLRTLLLTIAISLLIAGCGVNISIPGISTGGTSGCQGNCTLGTGVQGVQVFVEPDTGEGPVVNAIESAKQSVWLEMYLMSDSKVVYALEDAAHHGADVRVMLEPHPFGGSPPTRVEDELRAAGVKVEDSNPSFALTHEKGMVIDGTTAFIMTANFSRAGLGGYGGYSKYSDRDYGIIDTNQQDVQAVMAIFQADWNRSSVQINDPNLVVSPINSRGDISALLNSAKSTIFIESEEMNDSSIEQILTGAAQRGVKVEVVLPSGNSNAAGIATIKQGGVQVRQDSRLYIHAKQIIIDGQKAFVGSENFSQESLDQNRELGIIVADPNVLQTLQQAFQTDWNESYAA